MCSGIYNATSQTFDYEFFANQNYSLTAWTQAAMELVLLC
jgi:hypothetical protein